MRRHKFPAVSVSVADASVRTSPIPHSLGADMSSGCPYRPAPAGHLIPFDCPEMSRLLVAVPPGMEGLFEFPDPDVWHLNWPTCMNLGSGCCCPLAASRCPASSKTSGALTAAFLSDRRSVSYATSALTLGETVPGVLQSL